MNAVNRDAFALLKCHIFLIHDKSLRSHLTHNDYKNGIESHMCVMCAIYTLKTMPVLTTHISQVQGCVLY